MLNRIPSSPVAIAKRSILVLAVSLTCLWAAPERIALTFLLGAADTESTPWGGELLCPDGMTIEQAGRLDFYPQLNKPKFRIARPDRLVWEGSSMREVMRDYFQKRPVMDLQSEPIYYPLKPYPFTVQLAATQWAPITVKTAQGEFQVDPLAISYDQPAAFLDGKVRVERSLPTMALGSCQGPNDAIVYNDFPAICATPDGATWTAYIAYQGRAFPRVSLEKAPTDFAPLRQKPYNDQLLVVRELDGEIGEPAPVTSPGQNLFQPAIAARAGSGPLVVWSQKLGERWALRASIRQGDGWIKPITLTTSPGPDIYPALTATDDGYWLAWQSNQEGTFRILLAKIDEATLKLGTAIEITDGTANCWMPSIAVDSQGTVAVGYDTYAKGDYDVYCALLNSGTKSPKQVPVATSLRFEDRASVAFDKQDRLWIAWEEAGENWGKDAGGPAGSTTWVGERIDEGRTLRVACLDKGLLRTPKASLDPLIPLQQTIQTVYGKPQRTRESIFEDEKRYAYYPRLAAGADGRLCLAFRQHDYMPDKAMAYQTIWSNYLTVLDGDHWTQPARLVGSSGYRHCAPVICALPQGGIAVAGASDGRASTGRQPCEKMQNVQLARFAPAGETKEPVLNALIEEEPATPLPLVAAEREAVKRMRDFRATVGGKTYRILRGDFHRHTTFSGDSGVGDGSIDDAFRYARDAAKLDTMGNGDHDNGSGFEYPWYITQKFYDIYFLPDHFVPMYSYERSVTANGPQGHKNIIMPERGVRVLPVHGSTNIDKNGSIEDTRLLFQFLRQYHFVSIPHTIATGAGGNFVDDAPDVNCVVEIYQGARNAYEYPECPRGSKQGNTPGFYWNLLKAGKRFGVIASSDHRSTHMSYAMLYVPEPTREDVMDAFRQRHCYAATDNILLDVRIGDHMMGDAFSMKGAPELEIHVVGTGPIKSLDIIRNAEIYHTVSPGEAAVDLAWQDPAPVAGESSYYVRIIQENGEIAWGTPLWVTRD